MKSNIKILGNGNYLVLKSYLNILDTNEENVIIINTSNTNILQIQTIY